MTEQKNKIIWINFLHFYQPPTTDNETIIEAAEKSYKRIIGALKRNKKIKFTLNVTGCLLEKLEILGYDELINDLKAMVASGQIELTGSAAFHPLLALLPDKEIIRQIKINDKILKKYFGKKFRARGFFIPEAAYGIKVAKIVKKLNYSWIMLDEITANIKSGRLDNSRLYIDKNSGLKIIFRQRQNSKKYAPQTIFKLIEELKKETVITATDAELYGLRHNDFTGTFEKLLKRPEIKTLTVSQYLAGLRKPKKITLRASSWESTEKELKNNLPYFLWHNKKNKIQTKLWQLAGAAMANINKYPKDENYFWSRQHLDKGLASCTFWWASAHDFRLYGPPAWNPDEIEKGANELIRSIRALANPKTRPAKIKAEKLYIKIKQLIWHKHWHYYWLK
ncbi:MAG: polysaccharide deacetylase family protein [bacterium]|nr:polysaccharide deacetylase family protein [bacterium]